MFGQMNRRFFVKLSAISLTAVPLGNLLMSHPLSWFSVNWSFPVHR